MAGFGGVSGVGCVGVGWAWLCWGGLCWGGFIGVGGRAGWGVGKTGGLGWAWLGWGGVMKGTAKTPPTSHFLNLRMDFIQSVLSLSWREQAVGDVIQREGLDVLLKEATTHPCDGTHYNFMLN
jgi:hypothetical protein